MVSSSRSWTFLYNLVSLLPQRFDRNPFIVSSRRSRIFATVMVVPDRSPQSPTVYGPHKLCRPPHLGGPHQTWIGFSKFLRSSWALDMSRLDLFYWRSPLVQKRRYLIHLNKSSDHLHLYAVVLLELREARLFYPGRSDACLRSKIELSLLLTNHYQNL